MQHMSTLRLHTTIVHLYTITGGLLQQPPGPRHLFVRHKSKLESLQLNGQLLGIIPGSEEITRRIPNTRVTSPAIHAAHLPFFIHAPHLGRTVDHVRTEERFKGVAHVLVAGGADDGVRFEGAAVFEGDACFGDVGDVGELFDCEFASRGEFGYSEIDPITCKT